MAVEMDWIMVTGQPGAGKTTAVRALMKHIIECNQKTDDNLTLSGFYTEEVLGEDGKRIGFDVVTVPASDSDEKRGILSRIAGHGLPPSYPKTGKYFVDVAAFEELALPSLTSSKANTIFVLDEIGRMELHSSLFQQRVQELLNEKCHRLVGAITAPRYGHRVPFCDYVSAQSGVHVHNVKKSNRNDVVEMLKEDISSKWFSKSKDDKEPKEPQDSKLITKKSQGGTSTTESRNPRRQRTAAKRRKKER